MNKNSSAYNHIVDFIGNSELCRLLGYEPDFESLNSGVNDCEGTNESQWTVLFSSSEIQADSYVRNNRSNGCKNLRCFPVCNHRGHSQVLLLTILILFVFI